MRILATLLVLATAVSPGAVVADDGNGEKQAKKICKTVKVTGSRMAKKTCKTEQAWKNDEERSTGEDLVVKNDQYRVDQSANLGGPN